MLVVLRPSPLFFLAAWSLHCHLYCTWDQRCGWLSSRPFDEHLYSALSLVSFPTLSRAEMFQTRGYGASTVFLLLFGCRRVREEA